MLDSTYTDWTGCPPACSTINTSSSLQSLIDGVSTSSDTYIQELLTAASSGSTTSVRLDRGIHPGGETCLESGHFTLIYKHWGYHCYVVPELGGKWAVCRITYKETDASIHGTLH